MNGALTNIVEALDNLERKWSAVTSGFGSPVVRVLLQRGNKRGGAKNALVLSAYQ
jgi:hypothetical protein